ncbi:MAG: hypothetical protein QOH13_439 [Thermoleophilaceae bacterium]|nr:hypothetical protein [Pseudonocardiales bacterium]MEA2424029.1 hypothetical protein [Thermoleophilaceae bacterium]
MPLNDPTDTGGLFVGRRPGTRPIRYRDQPVTGSAKRRRADDWLARLILVVEVLLCLTLWGPQPIAWLWVGGHVQGATGSVEPAIMVAFVGMLGTLFFTLMIVKRLDYAWRIVRRAAGHPQTEGAVERVFVISAGIAVVLFTFWFLVIAGPGPQIAPTG